MTYSSRHRQTMLLLLAALLLRAGIPDGYMPSAPGSGQLFELCPAGVPAGFMQALSGSGQHHHHNSDASESHYDASHCPIGHLLSAAVAVDVDNIGVISGGPNAMDTPLSYMSPMMTEELAVTRGIASVSLAPEAIGGNHDDG